MCADGACRAQCREDRDCDPRWVCAPSGFPGFRACLPPASPVLCAFRSECPAGALCVDGRCRMECAADVDCDEGDLCEEGSCTGSLRFPDGPPRQDAGVTRSDGGGLACGGGLVPCGRDCVDLSTARGHCGACGVACPPNMTCRGGACFCDEPFTHCESACVDLRESAAHCGACQASCPGPCHEGRCCGALQAFCDGACIDVSSSDVDCGDCGVTCAGGTACSRGRCAVVNDECADAMEIPVIPGASSTVRIRTADSTDSPRASCDLRLDTFYAVTLVEREVVALELRDDPSGMFEYLGTECPTEAPASCVPSGLCGVRWAGVLGPGRHYFVLETTSARVGTREVVLQHAPVGDAPVERLSSDASVWDGTVLSGSVPGACEPGPTRVFYWVRCLDETLRASTCGSAVATVLQHASSCARDDATCMSSATLSVRSLDGALGVLLLHAAAPGTVHLEATFTPGGG